MFQRRWKQFIHDNFSPMIHASRCRCSNCSVYSCDSTSFVARADTLPESKISSSQKGNVVSQPPFFRGHVSFRNVSSPQITPCPNHPVSTCVSSTETRSVFFLIIEAGHLLVWVIVGVWSWLGSLRWKCLEVPLEVLLHQFTHFKEILFITKLHTKMWLGVRSHAQNKLIHTGRYNL